MCKFTLNNYLQLSLINHFNWLQQASIRAFLLTNLYESNNQIAWKPNLPILHEAVGSVGLFPEDLMSKRFESPSLFIRGAKSSYIPDTDIPEIKKLFPAAKFDTIQGSGHWPHADNVKAFLDSLLQFLKLWLSSRFLVNLLFFCQKNKSLFYLYYFLWVYKI